MNVIRSLFFILQKPTPHLLRRYKQRKGGAEYLCTKTIFIVLFLQFCVSNGFGVIIKNILIKLCFCSAFCFEYALNITLSNGKKIT